MRNDKPNIIVDKTIEFSLSIIKYCEVLENQKKYILCERSEGYSFQNKFREDLDQIIKIISKIISSAKGKIPGFIWSMLFVFSNFQIFKLSHL